MIRLAVLTLFLAGCASTSMSPSAPPQRAGAQTAPQNEVHRGLLTNQKSSPDAPSGEGGGSTGGRGGP